MAESASSVARRQRRLFLAALMVLLSIYAMAATAKPVAKALRAHGMLRFAVVGMFLLAAVGVGVWLVRRGGRLRGREVLLLGTLALIYGVFLSRMTYPEEAFHFLEYGLLGALLQAAFSLRQGLLVSGGWALVLTSLAGVSDEVLQHFVPDRFFDLRDIALNAFAGLLAIGATMLWQRWERET